MLGLQDFVKENISRLKEREMLSHVARIQNDLNKCVHVCFLN